MLCSNMNKNKKKARRDCGATPLHFLRIVLGQDVKFHLPEQFVRKYGNGLSKSALIQAPTGPLWKVELERGDDQIWFGNGWQEFVDYFSLKTCSSLVFRYEGNSRFNVPFIFEPDALESKRLNDIRSREANWDVKLENPKVEVIESGHDSAGMKSKIPAYKGKRIEDVVEIKSDHDSDGIAGGNSPTHDKRMNIQEVIEIESDHDSAGLMRGHIPTYKRMGIQDKQNVRRSGEGSDDELKFQTSRKYGSKNGVSPVEQARRGTSASRRCRSSEAPRKMQPLATKREAKALRKDANLKSGLPFFEVAIEPVHLTKPRLYIPLTFWRKHFMEKSGGVILQTVDGGTWSVGFKVYKGARAAWFSRGWKEFVLYKNLQVGDTCRFELQRGLEMCFKVNISRAGEDANHHSTAAHRSKTGHVGGKRCLRTRSQFESGCTSKSEGIAPPRTSKESNVPLKKIKTEHGMFPQVMQGGRASRNIQRRMSKGNVRAFLRASKLKSNHPSFKIVITASFLCRAMPALPRWFYKEHMKGISQDVILKVKDKLWSLRVLASSKLGGGWHQFASKNNLLVGDVCVFEMINGTSPTVFKVTIFSGSNA